jgi:hypothetical protein
MMVMTNWNSLLTYFIVNCIQIIERGFISMNILLRIELTIFGNYGITIDTTFKSLTVAGPGPGIMQVIFRLASAAPFMH